MSLTIKEAFENYEEALLHIQQDLTAYEGGEGFREQQSHLIEQALRSVAPEYRERLRQEIEAFGPLDDLLHDNSITEILVNAPTNLWVERKGRLEVCSDGFLSEQSFRRIIEKICLESGALPSMEYPSGNGKWRGFRVHVVRAPIGRSTFTLSLRRHPDNPWTLEKLEAAGWCTSSQGDRLRHLLRERANFLVVGATGSGKTSILNSLIAALPLDQRLGVIEDTDEISIPGQSASFKLLTREASPGGLGAIDQGELVRQCLRMRPDRLVLGEIRGDEAKDFLMAISTGHSGSFGTLHADDPAQALLRLEMLIQMGAPHWSLTAIRKLIRFGIQYVLVTGKNENGERRLRGIHRLVSLEDSGFLLERVV